MADEEMKEVEAEEVQPEGAPAAAEKTEETPDGHMIPKTRFDEVNQKYRELKKQFDDIEKAKAQAEETALAEQGKYKELYEKSAAEMQALKSELEQERFNALRRQIAQDAGHPQLWNRISGDDETALKADMKALLDAMPKAAVASTGGASGSGGAPANSNLPMPPEEFAALYGINPKFVPK